MKKLFKQTIAAFMVCVLLIGIIGTNTAFASTSDGNDKIITTSSEKVDNNIAKNISSKENSTELNKILEECKEVKTDNSSVELRRGEMVSVSEQVSSVSVYNYTTMAIMKNGDLYCWGHNECGQIGNGTIKSQTKPVKVLSNVSSVSISISGEGSAFGPGHGSAYGYGTIAAITKNGDLYCWGHNNSGQVGNGTTMLWQLTPVKVLSDVSSVSISISGHAYSYGTVAAITKNGDLYCWGYNEFGQVGNGTTKNQTKPVKVLNDVSFVSVSMSVSGSLYGYGTVAAIANNGDLYCWGYNDSGQVGNGTTENQTKPVKVLSDVSSVSMSMSGCGYGTVAAITKNGDLYCWGYNDSGQVGNDTTESQTKPVKVLSDVSSVSMSISAYGYGTVAAITKNGDLYCWGYNNSGQVGNGTTMFFQLTPVKVLSNVSFVSVSMSKDGYMFNYGYGTVTAITKNGDLYCWGYNEFGQVGNGTTENQTKPVKVLSDVSSVFMSGSDSGSSFGSDSVAAITKNGDLYCWGYNEFGQVGNGTTENQTKPVKVLSDVNSVSMPGYNYGTIAAITKNGDLYCWGYNGYGQVGNGTTENQLTPVKVLPIDDSLNDDITKFSIISSISGKLGDTITLSGSLTLPKDKETSSDIIKSEVDNITWTSGDSSIAEVTECEGIYSEDNHSAKLSVSVTPHKSGTVVIVGRTSDGVTASCMVTVNKKNTTSVTDFTVDTAQSGSAGQVMYLSSTLTLDKEAKTTYENLLSEAEAVQWISSDPDIIDDSELTCDIESSSDNYSATLTLPLFPKKKGTVTITGKTSNGLTADCVLTVGDFDEDISHASHIYFVNHTSDDILEQHINKVVTPSCHLYEEAEKSGLTIFSQAWKDMHTVLEAVDDPSSILKVPFEKVELYEGIIFSLFETASENTLFKGKDIINNVNSFLSTIKTDMKTIYGIDVGNKYNISEWPVEQRRKLKYLSDSYFESKSIVKSTAIISKITDVVNDFSDLYKLAEYQCTCMAIMEMNESYKNVMQDMYDACPAGNQDLKLALKRCITTMNMSEEQIADKISRCRFYFVGNKMLQYGVSKIWDYIRDEITGANPYVALLWAAYKSFDFISNSVFNTSNIAEKTVKLEAVANIRNLVQKAYEKEKNSYEDEVTSNNAKDYLAAIDVNFKYLDEDCNIAYEFTKTISDSLMEKICSAFGKSNTEEVKEEIQSIQLSYNDTYEGLMYGWVINLEQDCPEQYPNYKHLLDETADRVKKKYNIACPVDVYIYNKSGELVASVIDNIPFCKDDSLFTVAVIDNEKEIWLYDDKEHYTFKYSGTDTGTMDINVEEYDADGNISRKVKHINVALEKDLTYTSSDDMASGSNTYDLEENGSGKNIKPVVDTLNKELKKYKVNIKNGYMVNSENRGYTGSYYAGEKFTIYANIPDGAVWTGWKSNISDNIFSDKNAKVTTITMPAEDIELSATYNINSASTTPDVSPSIAPTLPPENSPSTKPSGTSESNISSSGNGVVINSGGVATVYTTTPIPSPSQTPVPDTTPTPVATSEPTTIPTIAPEDSTQPSIIPSPSASPDTETDNKAGSEKNIKKGLKFTDKKTKAVYKIISTGKTKFVSYVDSTKENAASVTVPASVQFEGKTFKVVSIEKGAFKNNKKLKSVKIGKNVKTIGKEAFSGCKNLSNVKMGKNIATIKDNAFNKCTSLTKITIPAKVKKIGKKAFYKCKKLQYILVKTKKLKINDIGKDAFGSGYANPRVKSDKSVWKQYQNIFISTGLSNKAVFIINPVKLVI